MGKLNRNLIRQQVADLLDVAESDDLSDFNEIALADLEYIDDDIAPSEQDDDGPKEPFVAEFSVGKEGRLDASTRHAR